MALYKERNIVERFFGYLKQFRRVATRYDKHIKTIWASSISQLSRSGSND